MQCMEAFFNLNSCLECSAPPNGKVWQREMYCVSNWKCEKHRRTHTGKSKMIAEPKPCCLQPVHQNHSCLCMNIYVYSVFTTCKPAKIATIVKGLHINHHLKKRTRSDSFKIRLGQINTGNTAKLQLHPSWEHMYSDYACGQSASQNPPVWFFPIYHYSLWQTQCHWFPEELCGCTAEDKQFTGTLPHWTALSACQLPSI